MADVHAELRDMIARVRYAEELGARAAPDVASAVEDELRRTIAAGTTPEGEPWELTKEGKRPLQNAASALGVAAVGSTVFVRLKGPEARHHKGSARGGIRRAVIPSKNRIPAPMAARIRDVLSEHFDAHVRGGDSNG